MKIIVMGAGAVGGYYGALLARAGTHEVWFIARGEHLKRIRQDGLLVQSVAGDFRVMVKATEDPSEAGLADLILNCVKAYDLENACRLLLSNMGPGSVMLTLQNGVEAPKVAGAVVGSGRVVGGIAYVGSRMAGPGVIQHMALGRVTIGELDGARSKRVEELAGLFEAAGIPCRVSTDIRLDMWKKLVWNTGFNAVCALTGLTAQDVIAQPEGERIVREAMSELISVARARGLALSPEMASQNIELTRRVEPVVPSMAQDTLRGKPTEIEEMNGVVVRLGETMGVPTPVNRILCGLVHLIEGKR